MRRGLSLLLLVLCVQVVVGQAWATTYYVSTTGNDSTGTGAIDAPWRTAGKASSTMICGDTTYMRGGTYSTEGTIRFLRTNCTSSTPITLSNYPGEAPIINWGNQANTNNKIYVSPGSPWTTPVTDVTISGLEITEGYECVKLEASLRFTFRGNYCHATYNNAITGTQTGGNRDATIDRNTLGDIGDIAAPACGGSPTCNQTHGLYILGQNWTITNNIIYDVLAYGIQIDSGVPSPTPSSALYGGFSGLIAHNTIAYGRNRSAMVVWHNGVNISSLIIENNLLYENSQANGFSVGFDYTSGCSGAGGCVVTIRNNLYFGTGISNFSNGTCTSCTITGTVNATPVLVNAPSTLPASPDFRLQSNSPAINTGVAVPSVTTDFIGTGRPQGTNWDIGAYEFVGGNIPPAVPTGLVVN